MYNIAGQTIASLEANGARSKTVYGSVGRNVASFNPLGKRTTTVYNSLGQTSALVDAPANRHSFNYDSTGARTQLIDPLNRRTTSAYDCHFCGSVFAPLNVFCGTQNVAKRYNRIWRLHPSVSIWRAGRCRVRHDSPNYAVSVIFDHCINFLQADKFSDDNH